MGTAGGTELGTFAVVFLGSVSVKTAEGNDVCADAILRAKVQDMNAFSRSVFTITLHQAMKQTPRKSQLIVTSRGIFVIETKTNVFLVVLSGTLTALTGHMHRKRSSQPLWIMSLLSALTLATKR